jgi:hypothetical protein
MRRRSIAVALPVTLAAVLAATPAAAATAPEHFSSSDSFVLEDFSGSGLSVQLDVDARGTFVGNTRGAAGLFYGQSMVRQTLTFTNLANDLSISYVGHFVNKDQRVTDNGDGTLTILVLSAGGQRVLAGSQQLQGSGGSMTYEVLIDHAGTPSDPSDDEFLETLGAVRGEFTDSCPQVLDVIS